MTTQSAADYLRDHPAEASTQLCYRCTRAIGDAEYEVDDDTGCVRHYRCPRRATYLVAVYEEDRCYGGPEEGGWWYDAGTLVRTVRLFTNEEQASAYCRRLNARLASRAVGPNKGRRELSSVLSEGEYRARVFANTAPAGYPERKPRYE